MDSLPHDAAFVRAICHSCKITGRTYFDSYAEEIIIEDDGGPTWVIVRPDEDDEEDPWIVTWIDQTIGTYFTPPEPIEGEEWAEDSLEKAVIRLVTERWRLCTRLSVEAFLEDKALDPKRCNERIKKHLSEVEDPY